jgi:hypothetical protein
VVDTENQIDRGMNTCGGEECLNAITVKDPTCLLCPNIRCRDCYADKCMVCIKCTNIVTSQFKDATKADTLIKSFSVENKKVYIARKDIQKAKPEDLNATMEFFWKFPNVFIRNELNKAIRRPTTRKA